MPVSRSARPRTRFPLLVALGLALCAAPALAADDAAWIGYRQSVMDSIGDNMEGISEILKSQLPLVASIEHHANSLAHASRLIAPAFQQKALNGPNDAKPEIWQQPEKFAEAARLMQTEAEALAAAVKAGRNAELGERVKALGKSCGGCHQNFRKPKEESYKNR
jgi:cytochrome c556